MRQFAGPNEVYMPVPLSIVKNLGPVAATVWAGVAMLEACPGQDSTQWLKDLLTLTGCSRAAIYIHLRALLAGSRVVLVSKRPAVYRVHLDPPNNYSSWLRSEYGPPGQPKIMPPWCYDTETLYPGLEKAPADELVDQDY